MSMTLAMENKINPNKRVKLSVFDSSDTESETCSIEGYGIEEEKIPEKNSENVALGDYITMEYELLRLVLSYLPLRDLYAAAQVCKTWQSAVEVIKRSRSTCPQWFFWHCKQKELTKEELPNHMFSQRLFSEPELCLMFMTRALNLTEINCKRSKAPCPCRRDGKRCKLKHRVLHYMRAEIPNSPCIAVEGYGVVGSSHDLAFTAEIENFSAYAGVLLPKTSSFSIKIFHLTKSDCAFINNSKSMTDEEIKSKTKLSPSTEPIKCLLLFCKDQNSGTVEKFVASLEKLQGNKFAVGGGFFDRINLGSLVSMNERRHVAVVGIAFTGDGIHAASTVLAEHVVGEKQVSQAMEELRSCQLPGQESVAFMFACVGRGVEWYMTDNVESTSFRHHFPTTPLIGYFGSGEIGRKFLPASKNVLKYCKGDDDIIRSYTSVIVYLSFSSQDT